MQTFRRTVVHIALIGGLLVVCIWPAIYNGQPFLNPDTLQYIRYADARVAKIMGHLADWVQLAPRYNAEATSHGTLCAPCESGGGALRSMRVGDGACHGSTDRCATRSRSQKPTSAPQRGVVRLPAHVGHCKDTLTSART